MSALVRFYCIVDGVIGVNGAMEHMTSAQIPHITNTQTSIGIVDVGRSR